MIRRTLKLIGCLLLVAIIPYRAFIIADRIAPIGNDMPIFAMWGMGLVVMVATAIVGLFIYLLVRAAYDYIVHGK